MAMHVSLQLLDYFCTQILALLIKDTGIYTPSASDGDQLYLCQLCCLNLNYL